jgi:membrane protease subunit HflK
MKADHLGYARAVSVSLMGLALQLVLGLVLLIYALVGKDHAALSGSFLVLLLALPWLALAIVFDQHRRERLEHMEAQSLAAAQAREASVFETNAEDLRVAARRLAWMHKFLMPGFSLLLAGSMIAVGMVRTSSGHALVGPDQFVAPVSRGWALAIGVILAVIGFVFARFVSGMAKQAIWQNLRGGAGASVAIALVGLAMIAGQLAQMAGIDAIQRHLQQVLPAVGVLLGVEVIFNLLLNLYRPRKSGEVPRPAFDSKILSFVASPDRIAESVGGAINYQFGVEVTGTWAYQLVARVALALVLLGAGVVWLLTTLEVVEPNERALRLRNGALQGEVGPGLYAKLPWPFEQFPSERTTVARRVDLMTPPPVTTGAILWTNDHQVEEIYALVQPTRKTPTASVGATATPAAADAEINRDIALVAVEVPLVYTISDLVKWDAFAAPGARENLLRSIARREVYTYFAGFTEDDLLGAGAAKASTGLRQRLQQRFDEANAGVRVMSANLESAHPERESAKFFEQVVSGEQKGVGATEQAKTAAIRKLTEAVGSVELARRITAEIDGLSKARDRGAGEAELAAAEGRIEDLIMQAGGSAGVLIERARAERWQRHMAARGRVEAYDGQLAAYAANPKLYRADLYFQTLRDLWREARVVITPVDPWITLDLKDVSTGANILSAPSADAPN